MGSRGPHARQILPKGEANESESSCPGMEAVRGAGEPPSKRRCISSACLACRKRKSKCDGAQPICNACKTIYSSDCTYDLDADHRRKGALKRNIAELKDEKLRIGSIIEAIKIGSESDVDDITQLIRNNPDMSYEDLAESVRSLALRRQSQQSLEAQAAITGDLVSQFAGKATVSKAPESRHYGHTSYLGLHQAIQDDRTVGTTQIGSWTTVTDDTDFINHLFDLYFTWSHPWYLLFSEETFFHGLNDRNSKYCTPLLVNAILAVACHYSDRPEARADANDPTTTGTHFFTEAQRILQVDTDQASLTIVQALGVISIHQALNNYDSSGRRYAAQMISMAIELGLHISSVSHPCSQLTSSEIEARRITFWGCYVLDGCWAICVGKLSSLPREAIQLEKPTVVPKLDQTPWKPHGLPISSARSTRLEQPSYKYSLLLGLSQLCEIVNEITYWFYAPRDRITSRKLLLYHEKLEKWYKNLPKCLTIRTRGPTLPQVLTLHVFYHGCFLGLYRPFMKVKLVQTSKAPRQICAENANRISHLIQIQAETYGLKKSFFINAQCLMSAAIIHLTNLSDLTPPRIVSDETEIYAAAAIRGLNDMRIFAKILLRYIKILEDLVHKWFLTIPIPPKIKQALDELDLGACSSSTAMWPPALPNAPNNNTHTTSKQPQRTVNIDCRPSAPKILQMAPNGAAPTLIQKVPQNYFWTPLPDSFEGMPLNPQDMHDYNEMNQNMDITNMLDSGVSGDQAAWNRDGFMINSVTEEASGTPWQPYWGPGV